MTPEQRRKKAAEIWRTLSSIDVSQRVQKRNGLSYLSWAWAWGVLMDHYPDALLTYERFGERDVMTYEDGTCAVFCSIEIDGLRREMSLPVMDHRHKAVAQPTARQINDCRQRAMTKCLALFGLGHYIYAGEDVPPQETPEAEPTRPRPGVGTKPTRPVNGGVSRGQIDPRHKALAESIANKRTLADLYGDDVLKGAIRALQDDLSGSYGKLMSAWVAREQALGGGEHTRPARQQPEPETYTIQETNRS